MRAQLRESSHVERPVEHKFVKICIKRISFKLASFFEMEESDGELSGRPLKSLNTRIASPVEFINHTGRTINLKWLDYDGKAVIFATLERNNGLDVNTYVTHPWIAIDEQTNETMLLNFKKTYFPDQPLIRRVDYESRRFYAVRSQIHITTPGKLNYASHETNPVRYFSHLRMPLVYTGGLQTS